MRYHGLTFLILLLASFSAFAQTMPIGIHNNSREPSRTVVGNYLRMDYQGLRLDKNTWTRMKSLTTWKENPEWQSFTIVSRFDVSPGEESLRAATVNVQYTILGRFDLGIGYVPERRTEEVAFQLKDVDNSWKIDNVDPPIAPHVSRANAIAWMKSRLATEKDEANKIALQKALAALGEKP